MFVPRRGVAEWFKGRHKIHVDQGCLVAARTPLFWTDLLRNCVCEKKVAVNYDQSRNVGSVKRLWKNMHGYVPAIFLHNDKFCSDRTIMFVFSHF